MSRTKNGNLNAIDVLVLYYVDVTHFVLKVLGCYSFCLEQWDLSGTLKVQVNQALYAPSH
jgi:hypothetical protein